MIRLNDILEKVSAYHADADLDLIKKAYVYSAKVHQGQIRKSGEPYLVHPLEVAGLLADPARRATLGGAARAIVDRNRGALARTVDALAGLLEARHPSPPPGERAG